MSNDDIIIKIASGYTKVPQTTVWKAWISVTGSLGQSCESSLQCKWQVFRTRGRTATNTNSQMLWMSVSAIRRLYWRNLQSLSPLRLHFKWTSSSRKEWKLVWISTVGQQPACPVCFTTTMSVIQMSNPGIWANALGRRDAAVNLACNKNKPC